MIPVRLHLRNFLSYGAQAPPLDFAGIHVACLSGGNGEGKSALLDAITWALWGEARKSSELRKPDEDLLRSGEREMEVDFEFALEDTCYRVVRSYRLSASGKTPKPGLEFQISADGEVWQPLTAESVRATQGVIDARLGIDYETFVNSTFLLQGRSDEFTRKKPGERKLILGRILALDRYERLAQAAGRRWSALGETLARLDADAARLSAALEDAAAWAAEHAEVARAVGALTDEAARAAAREAAAAARLTDLAAVAREAATLRADLAASAERRAELVREGAALAAQIEAAAALVEQADAIEADHERYEALRARRAALDELATLARGLDTQVQQLTLDLQKATSEVETQVLREETALRSVADRARDLTQKLAGRDRALRSRDAARAAEADLAGLAAQRAALDADRTRLADLDRSLAVEASTLRERLAHSDREATRLRSALDAAEPGALAALDEAVAQGESAAATLEDIRTRGSTLSATVAQAESALADLAARREAVQERKRRILESEDEACPTCGTHLTETHRAEVAATYTAEIGALDDDRGRQQAALAQARAERDALRDRFRSLKAAADAGQHAATERSALQERLRRSEADRTRLAALDGEARALREQIDAETFGADLRAERETVRLALRASTFDEARFVAVQKEAALRTHWEQQVDELDAAAEQLGRLRADEARRAEALAALREQLASGAVAAPLRERLHTVAAQRAAVGYDPAEHDAVSRDMSALADAPRRLAQLLDGRRRLAEWTERRAALAAERAALDERRATQEAALAEQEARLAARADAERDHAEAAAARANAQQQLAEAQSRLGALTERLDRAARDRAALKAARTALRAARQERALYTQLKRAFGRHGIPSLIIEEALPEIEERANDLLARLSGGQTRVSLDTLRDMKTGGTKETLEIKISDAQGNTRAYETYSGGEAFRVNFALRIALSQMLAERSGTRIRTLVIDEGFGTQDKEGLQALVGAIEAIRDDFDKILVVTHLDELKAAFPVRIEVRKEAGTGSTFEVVGV